MKNARKVGGGYSPETQLKIDEYQKELYNMAPQFQKLQEILAFFNKFSDFFFQNLMSIQNRPKLIYNISLQ